MTNRQTIIAAAVALVAAPVGITAARAPPNLSRITAYAFSFPLSEARNSAGGPCRSSAADRQYASLCGYTARARPKDVPRWNFHKYLIGRDGYIAEVFAETVEPSDTRIKTAIARTLAET